MKGSPEMDNKEQNEGKGHEWVMGRHEGGGEGGEWEVGMDQEEGGMKEGDDGEGFLLQGEREVTPSVKLSAQSINQAD